MSTIEELDTPTLVVDLDAVENNIRVAQQYCVEHGLDFRPHIKSHKMPEIAHLQLAAGAVGITCQKISEAEVFARAGFSDILLTYPVVGDLKSRRLAELVEQVDNLRVVGDSPDVVEWVSQAARRSGRQIGFLIECDTGGRRLGVQRPTDAAHLGESIASAEGLRFDGLMTFPTTFGTDPFMFEASERLAQQGLHVGVVSGGGTPGLFRSHESRSLTEVRAGEYVFMDRAKLLMGLAKVSDLAARVRTTIVGRPTADRGICDAGSKSLSMDPAERVDNESDDSFGYVCEYPEAVIYELSEEHGHIDFSRSPTRPRVGETISIVPNHVCPVFNLFPSAVLHRSNIIERQVEISARSTLL